MFGFVAGWVVLLLGSTAYGALSAPDFSGAFTDVETIGSAIVVFVAAVYVIGVCLGFFRGKHDRGEYYDPR